MKNKSQLLSALVIGLIGGLIGAFIYQTVLTEPKSIIYDKFVSIPQTEISSYTLLQKMGNGDTDYIILDVRNKNAYNLGHIRGSISMPFAEIKSRFQELPKDKTIVVYCWSSECMLGPSASGLLTQLGVKNLKELRIGWCEWSERGYPIEGERYIVAGECLQPQRSINNETVKVVENV